MDRLRRVLTSRTTLLLIVILGFVFFARNAHLQLAPDDIAWLNGEEPTVFDQYRLIPRLFFVSLNTLFGPSPMAALGMIFVFHAVNVILVHDLADRWLVNPTASSVAATVFAINPLTLSTLTWLSCFSYVLGTTMALLSLASFWKSQNSSSPGLETSRPWLWRAVALGCYGAGLFCSHEVLFLPVLFVLLSWLRGGAWLKRCALLFALAMSVGLLVNLFFYDFERFGVEVRQLFSLGFVSACVSSALSFGLSLWLAYPLSFFVPPVAFLQFSFTEPVRWGMTLAMLACGVTLYKPSQNWRVWLALILSCAALITPYIIRLYLMPLGANYDISYVLPGRVFYLPFVILALVWGRLVGAFYEKCLKGYTWKRCLPVLPLGAYSYALVVLYHPRDFMGLAVVRGTAENVLPSWNPLHGAQPLWLASLALIGVIAVVRLAIRSPRWRSYRPLAHRKPM